MIDDQDRFDVEVMAERYEQEQDALPIHKRDGYAEHMAELADIRRKEQRENA